MLLLPSRCVSHTSLLPVNFMQNPATMNLCSKCYRESQGAEQNQQQKAAAQQPGLDPVKEDAVTTDDNADAADPLTSVASSSQESACSSERRTEAEKPVQTNRKRCFCCHKKVGLLGFECRCGFVFCASHRHQDDHNCTFDYAAFDRERLAKANQKVEAAKVEKL